jgi:hypothetical protein
MDRPCDDSVDKGLCSSDIRHNLTFNALYRLPLRGNRLVESSMLRRGAGITESDIWYLCLTVDFEKGRGYHRLRSTRTLL